ncbi:carbonic anhydrase 6-like [Chelonus insularis]|uniref:carbonic anhydrase 6-like n=1 Tax=Chelonus insularis TaxID=460826 RepID=UPI00158BFBFF|nr:carbonic anhydrase 6-like [Chelonus insularis]
MFIIFFFSFAIFQQCQASDLTFRDANSWSKEYPQCGTKYQSPIAINTESLIPQVYDSPLISYHENEQANTYTFYNTGTGLMLVSEWPEGRIPYLSGGPLGEDKYFYDSTWFRWNQDGQDENGHIFDGESFPLFAHLHYYNEKYGSLEEASNYPDGLVAVAAKWAISNESTSPAFSGMIRRLPEVTEPGSQVEIRPLRVSDTRNRPDDDPKVMFYYFGSQVTPPCAPVEWFLPDYVHYLTLDELAVFRSIKLNNSDDHNTRPVQPLNDREVYKTNKYVRE